MHKIPSIPDHLQDILQERMKGQFEPLFDSNGGPAMTKNFGQKEVQIYLCGKTGKIYGGESGIYTLGYYGYLTDDEQREISNWRTRNVEKNRFDKADKVNFSDWKGEQIYDGNDFFIELDDLFDGMIEAYGFNYDEWQDYVWATTPVPIISPKGAYDVYQSDMEKLSDEYDWPVRGVEELQDSLNEFVELNKDVVLYQPDYSKALLISDQIEEFKKNHED